MKTEIKRGLSQAIEHLRALVKSEAGHIAYFDDALDAVVVEARVLGHGHGQEHAIADVNAGLIDDLIRPRLAALSASGAGEQPALIAYMTATTREARSAAFLRTYAERVRNNTAVTWEIPNTVASTLEDIATLLDQSASGAGIDPSQPIIQELRKLPRYWMHIPNAAASSTQVVCWVDVQRVIDQSAGVDRQAPQPFNVNHYVRVVLTAEGYRLLLKACGADEANEWRQQQERDGYTRWQLWELMRMFGEHMDNGCTVPFETTIEVEHEPRAGVGGAPPPAAQDVAPRVPGVPAADDGDLPRSAHQFAPSAAERTED